jgi:hypothetical protein
MNSKKESINEIERRIKSKLPKQEEEKREMIQKKAVGEKLAVEKVLYNNTLGRNRQLKNKV